MYRLLVVDDENFITDSLAHMLESVTIYELDVYKAYSAFQALEYLNRFEFNIVITDIRMPGMSGIELLKEIHSQWPSCQVIFLTGHDEFEYAYKAVQYRAARYVLKNEGDDVLLSAIAECIGVIDRETHNLELLSRAEEEMRVYKPMIRRSFLQSLLVGSLPGAEETGREFERLGIGLDPARPVMLLAARIGVHQAEGVTASVDLVVRDKIGHAVRSEIGWADLNVMVWIVQPLGSESCEHAQVIIKGMAESIQRVCASILGIKISFVFDATGIGWDRLTNHFSMLRHVVEHRLEKHSDIAIAGLEYFLGGPYSSNERGEPAFLKYRDALDRLSVSMTLDDIEEVDLYAGRLSAIFAGGMEGRNDLYTLELNTELNLMLLSYATRHELQEAFRDDAMFRMFLTGAGTGDACRRIEQFLSLARRLMALCHQAQKKSGEALIDGLLRYIRDNLDTDLSLCVLSEKVYLNPSYLSRRFKEVTGKSITDTIIELRVASACRLLEDNRHRISRIASMVGYESAAYFSRVFKRQMGITPQEYRDRKASMDIFIR